MGEIVLRINDDIIIDKVIALLAPYIAIAEIKYKNGALRPSKQGRNPCPI